jgi:prepilin-type N-terminal cleavage/methylation domain-containing protein
MRAHSGRLHPAWRPAPACESGFTLVELLIVMLIIGILAAIAIPSFFSQKDKAEDAKAKTVVRSAQGAIEVYATDHHGTYVGATPAGLATIEGTLTGTNIVVSGLGARTYVVQAQSRTSTIFTIERTLPGAAVLSCDRPGEGGCPVGGLWD